MDTTNSTPSVEQVAFDLLADSEPVSRRVIEIPLTPDDFLPDDAHRSGCNCPQCVEDRELF